MKISYFSHLLLITLVTMTDNNTNLDLSCDNCITSINTDEFELNIPDIVIPNPPLCLSIWHICSHKSPNDIAQVVNLIFNRYNVHYLFVPEYAYWQATLTLKQRSIIFVLNLYKGDHNDIIVEWNITGGHPEPDIIDTFNLMLTEISFLL